jgi:hypothetical protein
LKGFTELTLAPLAEKIHLINLNCKQCKIYSIYFNGIYEAEFDYYDPSLLKTSNWEESKKDLQSHLAQEELAFVSVDADEGNGELSIKVPDEFLADIEKESKQLLNWPIFKN